MNSFEDDPYELSQYELERKPRKLITDESTTTIQVRNLNVELTCPVCLGILHHTMTVMECLHRFCEGCISKSLRLGKKECPTCRVKCSSKRHLRPDPTFDSLIAQIYPNLEEFEAKEESMIEQINKTVMQSGSLKDSIEMGKRRQAMAKGFRPKKEVKSSPPLERPKLKKPKETRGRPPLRKKGFSQDDEEDYEESKPSKAPEPSESEVSFVLLRHEAEKNFGQLPNKYLRTSRQLTVRHLCKFLGKKFNTSDNSIFKIGLFPNSQPLTEDITLDVIERELWQRPGELQLYYRS